MDGFIIDALSLTSQEDIKKASQMLHIRAKGQLQIIGCPCMLN
jgi:hypothetical protein